MYIKYNLKLKKFSQQFRQKPTAAEQEMWEYLKWQFPLVKFNRQKPLDHFIVDFYCLEKKLIIEIDGEIHNNQKEKDLERDNLFATKYKLTTIRFTNNEVFNNKPHIKNVLLEFFKKTVL